MTNYTILFTDPDVVSAVLQGIPQKNSTHTSFGSHRDLLLSSSKRNTTPIKPPSFVSPSENTVYSTP